MSVNEAAVVPQPVTVGPEMTALRRFYPDVTWAGTIEPGGMGPGTPAMTAVGHGRHETLQDGRWIAGTYEQQQHLLDGTPVLTWQLRWVAGWDPVRRAYRATMNDNYGHADVMTGHIDGDRLVFTTDQGAPVQLRLTWIADGELLFWRNEARTADGRWALIEEYRMTPVP
jgi:hypothetical protein